MKIRPLADKVLVQRLEAETTTAGGIVLPDSAKEKPQEGKIVSVGDGKVLDDGTVRKLQVKKGDVVLFKFLCDYDTMPRVAGKPVKGIAHNNVNNLSPYQLP